MRLLRFQDDGEYSLVSCDDRNAPPYAILSHTWRRDHDEVTFQDVQNSTGKDKKGYEKIHFCGARVKSDKLQYCWIDTCCIDKSSSSEEAKSINSMYRWYHQASKCYVYLADVSVNAASQSTGLSDPQFRSALRQSRWFTRGWTLQELLAPPVVEFFSREGHFIGDKSSLEAEIHDITGISCHALRGKPMSEFSVPERISWAANRETTVEEDQVYSLLGIFEVYMPVIYGEGMEHAFQRLRKEISTCEHPYPLYFSSCLDCHRL